MQEGTINQAFLQSVLLTASDSIIIINSKGTIILLNDVVQELFGFTKEEMIGQNIKMITPEPHQSNHDQYIKNHIETGINKVIGIGREVMGQRKDGSLFPCRLALSKFFFDGDIYFTGVIHDLTKEKETEQKLIFTNKNLENLVDSRTSQLMESVTQLSFSNQNLELEIKERIQVEKKLILREKELIDAIEKERNLNLLKSRFVSIASHEFRTPLSNILSSINLIEHYQENQDKAKTRNHLEKIKNNIQYLTGILNEFLTLTQIENGKFNLYPETFSISKLVFEIVEEFNHIKKPQQSINLEDRLPGNFTFTTDKNCLRHIFHNLINNAIKYSGDKSTITLLLDYVNKSLIIEIADNGIGIPLDEQKLIFDIFYRGSNVLNIQGTGLGLNIVKKYLDLIKGEIVLKSRENEGTIITINIPHYEI
ncbi:MAG: PAS domain-containing sensor histidine kinase [Saprospiraceae bacterium]|nr:PAS domain-containing sensor histidine kinase [Saprospiraceae bacterium]